MRVPVFALALLVVFGIEEGAAQCLVANPSFEIAGVSGEAFAGWNQFGNVAADPEATHGSRAARITGRTSSEWSLSALWQRLDAAPGERYRAELTVGEGALPFSGSSHVLLNIEWRDAAGALIDYETHVLVDASTAASAPQRFVLESAAAPAATAALHLLIGTLQDPAEPIAEAVFDEVRLERIDAAAVEQEDWGDFPGGRRIVFSGLDWRVKGPGVFDPGTSPFCDTADCVWVDAQGRLHLTIAEIDGATMASTEVALEDPLGYGDYLLTTVGRLDDFDPGVIFGYFLWEYAPCYDPANGWWNPYNEIDIEFGRWGDPAREAAQFVVQPYDHGGNLRRFDPVFADGERTTHAFRWRADRVEFRSWRGGVLDEGPQNMLHEFVYEGPHLPRPGDARVHLNLWQFGGPATRGHEVVLEEFVFVPEPAGSIVVAAPGAQRRAAASLVATTPNPFNPSTLVRFDVHRAGRVRLEVFDPAGRRVRTMLNGVFDTGRHEILWNGADDRGLAVASGVYLLRLVAGETVETRRVTLLK